MWFVASPRPRDGVRPRAVLVGPVVWVVVPRAGMTPVTAPRASARGSSPSSSRSSDIVRRRDDRPVPAGPDAAGETDAGASPAGDGETGEGLRSTSRCDGGMAEAPAFISVGRFRRPRGATVVLSPYIWRYVTSPMARWAPSTSVSSAGVSGNAPPHRARSPDASVTVGPPAPEYAEKAETPDMADRGAERGAVQLPRAKRLAGVTAVPVAVAVTVGLDRSGSRSASNDGSRPVKSSSPAMVSRSPTRSPVRSISSSLLRSTWSAALAASSAAFAAERAAAMADPTSIDMDGERCPAKPQDWVASTLVWVLALVFGVERLVGGVWWSEDGVARGSE